ncbi:glutathione S-transferase [Microdochium trichocladiopsis]|uniref:glutathione transferase n=1 Tax=Microdochium trichocladiopsis TaxID=1682393 RepID=A0A9P8XXC5_9PEZI|nr:glutathione S-transferase [Microdochium trichocladiopsis]KAH7024542.1 glutathione S-transferase [Microdochium trichocladiopsis]
MHSTAYRMQPIKIWTTAPGPNGWKPIIYLEELNVPYEIVDVPFTDLISDEFRKVNPGGKVPVMEDPNTGIKIWESGAIILYIIEQFDKDNKLSFPTSQLKEFHLARQWLMFQVSQQGPFYGQLGWFNWMHPEKLPSASERYKNQTLRIMKLLDNALAESSGEGEKWLVGNKCSYADLAFVMYHVVVDIQADVGEGEDSLLKQFTHLYAWNQRLLKRPSVAKVCQMRLDAIAAEGFKIDKEVVREHAEELMAKEKERGV